ncbi:MAG: ABC transporter permease [Acidimicrobiales bacterium]
MIAATTPFEGRAVPAKDRARMVANEAAKGVRLLWAYRATLVPTVGGGIATYLVFQYFVGGGRILDELVAETAPAMFAYLVTYGITMRLVAGILEERNAGTLEQIHLSPLPAWQLAIGRLSAAVGEAVFVGATVMAVVLAVQGVEYPLRPAALVPLALTVAGAAGFALLIAAASFTYPGIGALVHIVQMAIMALNGTIAPAELFPRWLEIIAKLAPTTLGIEATRSILTDGESLGDLWGSGALGWLVLHTMFLVAAGWAVYQWQIRRGLRHGRLGPA